MQDKNLEKLQVLLKEMFQFWEKDLDFGIYSVMNQLAPTIENFINKDLKEKIEKTTNNKTQEERLTLTEELKKIEIKGIENVASDFIVNNELNSIYKETVVGKEYISVKEKLDILEKNPIKTSSTIYNEVYCFFDKFYSDGDFVANKKVDGWKYLVDGGDTSFTWATKDQYYVKSGINIQDREVELEVNDKKITVAFEIVEDKIEGEAKDAVVILGGKKEIKEYNEETETEEVIETKENYDINEDSSKITLFFTRISLSGIGKELKELGIYKTHYEKDSEGKTEVEKVFNSFIVKQINEAEKYKKVKILLNLNESDSNIKELLKTYRVWLAKMKSDFFIHKDLKKFLETELDYYLKNNVYKDIFDNDKSTIEIKMDQMKQIREICLEIIELLSTIENFQKKIFEKKPLVKSSNYVFCLEEIEDIEIRGKIIEELLRDKNKEVSQIKEWLQMGLITEKEYQSINREWIENNCKRDEKKLIVDTRFLQDTYIYTYTRGLLIKSDNYQGLKLLQKQYKEKIDCIYIDPPYNTWNDWFLYKDWFQTSSWLSFIENRLALSNNLLEGSLFVCLDENENYNIRNLGRIKKELIFKRDIVLKSGRWNGFTASDNFVKTHDNITFFTKGKSLFFNEKHNKKYNGMFREDVYTTSYISKDNVYNSKENLYRCLNLGEKTFQTQKIEEWISKLLELTTLSESLVLDYFVGSWTTTSVAHKLWRKWIWITNNESWIFDKITLPRMKYVLSGEQGWISKEVNWKGGWCFQYIELEQYEEVLNKIKIKRQDHNLTIQDINEIFNPENLSIFWEDNISLLSHSKFIENYLTDEQSKEYDLVETFNYLIGLFETDTSHYIYDSQENIVGNYIRGKLNSGKEVQILWIDKNTYSNLSQEEKGRIDIEIQDKIDKNMNLYYNKGGTLLRDIQILEILPEFRREMFN